MNRKLLVFLLVLVLGAGASNAQEMGAKSSSSGFIFDQFFTFAWDVSMPTGDNKFLEDVSFAGGKMEYRKMVGNHLSVGLDLTWNSYKEYFTYQSFHVNSTTDVTTDLYKFNYTLPMAVTIHNYFGNNGKVIPFAGLGVGALYCKPSLFFNIYEIYEENWGFLVRPEVGVLIKTDGDLGILLGARYSMSTNKESSFKIDNLQSLDFQLGLAWTY